MIDGYSCCSGDLPSIRQQPNDLIILFISRRFCDTFLYKRINQICTFIICTSNQEIKMFVISKKLRDSSLNVFNSTIKIISTSHHVLEKYELKNIDYIRALGKCCSNIDNVKLFCVYGNFCHQPLRINFFSLSKLMFSYMIH